MYSFLLTNHFNNNCMSLLSVIAFLEMCVQCAIRSVDSLLSVCVCVCVCVMCECVCVVMVQSEGTSSWAYEVS